MDKALPGDSKIELTNINGYDTVIIPHVTTGNVVRYLVALFLIAWLAGWTFFLVRTILQVTQGEGQTFQYIWLTTWSIGGVFSLYFLYRIAGKPVPEKLFLNRPNLTYDSGRQPLQFTRYSGQQDYYKNLWGKRTKKIFTPEQMKTLKLRETDSGNRLTVDIGAERISIAENATEIEREWLYDFLKNRYF